ncbi:MAG: hypothetical protein JKY92_06120, partial [Magnetovibrio sp.]|nr:hypothetical protein [Magnetovibrio sp.]
MKHLNRTLSDNASSHPQDVVATKLFLRNQGYYHAPKWGVSQFPDRALFDAIKAFQDSQGLSVDGVMKPNGETETAIKSQAQKLQNLGRNGDTILAHITPAEAQLLNDVTDGGSTNPNTGLSEFFLGDFFSGDFSSGLSDSFSSIGSSLSDSFSSFGDSLSSFSDSIGNSFSDASGTNSLLSSLQGQQNKLDSLLNSDAGKAVGNGLGNDLGNDLGNNLGSNMNATLSDNVSNALTQTKIPQASAGLGGDVTSGLSGGLTDNLPSAAKPLSSSTGLKYSLDSPRTPFQQSQNVKAIQAQQNALNLQPDLSKKQTPSFSQGQSPDQQSRYKQRGQNMFNKIDQQGTKAFQAPAAQAPAAQAPAAQAPAPQAPAAQARTPIKDQQISNTMDTLKAENPD